MLAHQITEGVRIEQEEHPLLSVLEYGALLHRKPAGFDHLV
jgi:hypothetical protein